MNQKSLMCVMTRLIPGHCVQNLLRRGNEKSSLNIKDLISKLVPHRERQFIARPAQIGVKIDPRQ